MVEEKKEIKKEIKKKAKEDWILFVSNDNIVGLDNVHVDLVVRQCTLKKGDVVELKFYDLTEFDGLFYEVISVTFKKVNGCFERVVRFKKMEEIK